ncbi:hypothetical protein [Lysinibacillus sphaericus]|uniref:hypothetical protein n=1 Tax=Lysinibacillus sphaericus TaxID=1421 RepID=UPI000C1A48D1|nr:hypothetical protein [Lysinibacillus sphaericus]PIJ98126.1 hypothetical protein CTN02_10315 [Lysinibacillus sphaericus]
MENSYIAKDSHELIKNQRMKTISINPTGQHQYINPLEIGVQESATAYSQQVVNSINELAITLKEFTLNEEEKQVLTKELVHSFDSGKLHDFRSLIERLTIINSSKTHDVSRLIELLKVTI